MHTGAVCTGFEQKDHGQIAACFADGSAAQGDFLIGADGIHSVIRRLMFPQVRLRYSGYIAWRGVVDFAGSSAPDRTSETWGRGARFGIVPIGQGRVYWFATANMPEDHRAAPGRHKPDLLQRFRGWHAPIEALIQATPDDAILYNQISDFPPLAHWSQRQVTILGDAAHPTTPNLGQGACQAIESSVVLTRCLAEEQDLSTALQRYERERMPRTAWITNTSWQVGSVAQLEHPALIAIRDFVMRSMPASITRAQIMKAAGYNV